MKAVQKGLRVAIPCNSKRKAEKLYQDISQVTKRVFLYTSDSDDQQKMEVAHCNEIWLGYDVVIYTPTIGSGVDFSPKEAHFDIMFAFGINHSNPAREFLQMMGRVRELKMRKVILCIPPLSNPKEKVLLTPE